jgi:hypothetical protein
MDIVQETSGSECHIPSSQPFKTQLEFIKIKTNLMHAHY